jgi:hypothetical protein
VKFEWLPQEVRREPELHGSCSSEITIAVPTKEDRALKLDERMVGIARRKVNCEPFVRKEG